MLTFQGNVKNPVFSILIPTWNNLDYLKLCLEGIRLNSTYSHQIIVIINEGSDGTLDWVKSQPDLTYLFSEVNMGICTGMNNGAKLALTPYLLYMNDDMYPLPGWDKVLKDEVEQIPGDAFFLSSTMIEPHDTGNPCVVVKNFGTDIASFKKDELLKSFQDLYRNDWNGATWPPNLLTKKYWDLVGGLGEEYSPGMYSDPDLSMKLWQSGVRYFKGMGTSLVYHFGTKSTGRIRQNNGKKVFIRKWKITPGDFAKIYLKNGSPFNGPLTEIRLNPFIKLKGFVKKMLG